MSVKKKTKMTWSPPPPPPTPRRAASGLAPRYPGVCVYGNGQNWAFIRGCPGSRVKLGYLAIQAEIRAYHG